MLEKRNTETEETVIVRQQRGKHVSATTNGHATVEKSLETVSSTRSVPRLYNEDQVDAGSNTSTVALRVVGGVEKGTQGLGV
jgi:hypothetical protein